MPGYYDQNGDWVEVDLPPDEGGGSFDPYGGLPPESFAPTQGGNPWATGDYGTPAGVPLRLPSKAQLARAEADRLRQAYLAAQTDYYREASDPNSYANVNTLKGTMDAARRDWDRQDKEADTLEKAEAAAAAKTAAAPSPFRNLPSSAQRYYQVWDPEQKQYVLTENPNYRAPQGASAAGISSPSALQNAATTAARLAMDRDKLAWEMSQAADKQDWTQYTYLQDRKWKLEDAAAKAQMEMVQAQAEARAAAEQQRQQRSWQAAQGLVNAQTGLYGNILGQIPQMYKYALAPGQTHSVGFEPGGPWARIMGQVGLPYQEQTYRVAPIQYDPAEIWRKGQDWLQQAWQQAMAQAEQPAQQGGA